MGRIHPNNFRTTLASGLSDTDTSITLSDNLPTLAAGEYIVLTITDNIDYELLSIDDNTGAPTYTIASRGLEGTSAANWSSGAQVSIRVTKGSIDDKQDLLDTAILSVVSLDTGDNILIKDDSDSDKLKQVSASDFIALSPLVKIATATASTSSALTFTGLGNYAQIIFVFNDITVSLDVSTGVFTGILMRTSTNNGSSYDSGASDYNYLGSAANAGPTSSMTAWNSNGADAIRLIHSSGNYAPGTATGSGVHGEVKLYNPSGTSVYKAVHSTLTYIQNSNQGGNFAHAFTSGMRKSTSDIDAVQFLPSQGTFVSGTITAYGLKK